MVVRQKKELTEEQKALRQFHKKSARHVVVFEADLSENEKRQIFSDADDLRQCGNRLLEIMKRNLEQLLRTKRYRALQSLYGKIAEAIRTLEAKEARTDEQEQKLEQLKEKRSNIVKAMAQMQEQYHVTWDFCRTKMMELKDQYNIPSIFALSRAEDIWQAVESTGGTYIEVPMEYRASQYDHTADTYIKKKLSQRMYCLSDGIKVQRDWYSSYLLYCINNTYTQIDKQRCKQKFSAMYQKEKQMIDTLSQFFHLSST